VTGPLRGPGGHKKKEVVEMFPFGSAHPFVVEYLKKVGVPQEKIYVTDDGYVAISNYAELPDEVIEEVKRKYVVGYMGYFLRDMVIVEPREEGAEEEVEEEIV